MNNKLSALPESNKTSYEFLQGFLNTLVEKFSLPTNFRERLYVFVPAELLAALDLFVGNNAHNIKDQDIVLEVFFEALSQHINHRIKIDVLISVLNQSPKTARSFLDVNKNDNMNPLNSSEMKATLDSATGATGDLVRNQVIQLILDQENTTT